MQSWTDKPWGRTRRDHLSLVCQIDEIDVLQGGYCSIHRHATKTNLFHLLSGQINIRQFTATGERLNSKYLHPGESLIVPAGIWHQFWSPLESRAVEVYLPTNGAVDPEDIERFAGLPVGGIETSYNGMGELWLRAFGRVEACQTLLR